jgi:acyl-coenzyme A thioesterase PaaI-like protein
MRELDGTLFGPEQPCFGCGPVHSSGFRLRFVEDGDEVVTRFLPDDRYQGPPGLMHGGLVFTIADELAARVIIA